MFDSAFQEGVKRPGTREMTAMLAGLMALNAFAIDSMIPALAAIGRSQHVAHETDQQLVVLAYFLGFAGAAGDAALRVPAQARLSGDFRRHRRDDPRAAVARLHAGDDGELLG